MPGGSPPIPRPSRTAIGRRYTGSTARDRAPAWARARPPAPQRKRQRSARRPTPQRSSFLTQQVARQRVVGRILLPKDRADQPFAVDLHQLKAVDAALVKTAVCRPAVIGRPGGRKTSPHLEPAAKLALGEALALEHVLVAG